MISSRGRAKHGAFQTAAEIYAGMLTTHGFMHAKGHPELAGSGMSLHDQASQGSHRGSIQAFRKPMFFESYRKRVSNSRLAQDPVAANMLSLGAAAPALGGWGARMIDTLAFWAQIVPGRVDGSGTVVRQRSPMVYQQLIDLAMASAKPGYQEQADQAPTAAAAAAALPGAAVGSAGVELQKLVLSDDDIEDFSE
ncbi:hypothetical protein FBU59_007299 [Linderina macrospora]|uniref:Uncharacterized protein n=1 Tax=Linderina macrospora TaxID=4868 RepID=A0ACC1IXF4_9FUNG|nr:hypothetical protein FBU59_007299 [Linderina macrospora]